MFNKVKISNRLLNKRISPRNEQTMKKSLDYDIMDADGPLGYK